MARGRMPDSTVMRVSPALAAEIGLNESIVLLQLEYLTGISTNERDGRAWTYQSITDLREMFPWWGRATLLRIIRSLRAQDLITTANYNSHAYDKTTWFALNRDAIAGLKCANLFQNGTSTFQTGTTESQNGTGKSQNGTTIPETTIDYSETTREREAPTRTATADSINRPQTRTVASPTKIPPITTTALEIPESLKNQPAPPRKHTERAPKPPSEMDVLRQHPAVQIYRETFGITPAYKAALDGIAQVSDLPKWSNVCSEWMLKGYKHTNIAGLLDVYAHGWQKDKPIAAPNWPRNGARAGGRKSGGTIRREQVPDATEAEREVIREKARKKIEERAARKAAQGGQHDQASR